MGSPPLLASEPPDEIRSVLRRAAAAPRLAVFDLTSSDDPSLGYSVVSSRPDPTFVTYVASCAGSIVTSSPAIAESTVMTSA